MIAAVVSEDLQRKQLRLHEVLRALNAYRFGFTTFDKEEVKRLQVERVKLSAELMAHGIFI